MEQSTCQKVDFLSISPHVRYVHEVYGTSEDHFLPIRILYDYEMMYVIKGSMLVKTDFKEYEIKSGDIHVMRPFVKHTRIIPKSSFCHYYSMHFDLCYMGKEKDFSTDEIYIKPCYMKLKEVPMVKSLSERTVFELMEMEFPEKLHTVESYKYLQAFEEVCQAFKEKPFGYEMIMRAGLLKLLSLLAKEIKAKQSLQNINNYSKEIAQIIQYMHEHYNKNIDLNMLAHEMGFSPVYLRRLFKQTKNKAPGEYVIDIRIEQAKKLLIEGKYNISQISSFVGYDDVHYFSRLFKKKEGMSPKQFVLAYKIGQ